MTFSNLFALPFVLRFRALESERPRSEKNASPPGGSAPPITGRAPSDPPPRPGPREHSAWELSAGVDPCTHARLVVAGIFSGRIG
jgi:hypothetical protein